MYIDTTKLQKAFKELSLGLNVLAKELSKTFTSYMTGIDNFIDEWKEIVIKLLKKQKFKPILKILPNKTYIRDSDSK